MLEHLTLSLAATTWFKSTIVPINLLTSNDMFDSGDFCRENGHMGRGEKWISTARYVTTYFLDGVVLLSQEDTGFHLKLEVSYGVSLGLCKLSDIYLNAVDVFDYLRVHCLDDVLFILIGQLESLWRPFIELLGVAADCCVALASNGCDNLSGSIERRRYIAMYMHL